MPGTYTISRFLSAAGALQVGALITGIQYKFKKKKNEKQLSRCFIMPLCFRQQFLQVIFKKIRRYKSEKRQPYMSKIIKEKRTIYALNSVWIKEKITVWFYLLILNLN